MELECCWQEQTGGLRVCLPRGLKQVALTRVIPLSRHAAPLSVVIVTINLWPVWRTKAVGLWIVDRFVVVDPTLSFVYISKEGRSCVVMYDFFLSFKTFSR